jgi:hypothetical protein
MQNGKFVDILLTRTCNREPICLSNNGYCRFASRAGEDSEEGEVTKYNDASSWIKKKF